MSNPESSAFRFLAVNQISDDQADCLYADPTGFWLGGWNHVTGEMPPIRITPSQARALVEDVGPLFWSPELTHGHLRAMGIDKRQAALLIDELVIAWEDADEVEIAEDIARRRSAARKAGLSRQEGR